MHPERGNAPGHRQSTPLDNTCPLHLTRALNERRLAPCFAGRIAPPGRRRRGRGGFGYRGSGQPGSAHQAAMGAGGLAQRLPLTGAPLRGSPASHIGQWTVAGWFRVQLRYFAPPRVFRR
jgi:hypothetical protein